MQSKIISTSGGRKDLKGFQGGRAYFLAIQGVDLRSEASLASLKDRWILIALNYLLSGKSVSAEMLSRIGLLAAEGKSVYLDSGCFTLAFAHAAKVGKTAPEVFMSSPRTLPFFEDWYKVYVSSVPQLIDKLWGVVELDFGSAKDRQDTRKRIFRDTGIRPIPVFRFGEDPVSVFENLVRTHDRVCLGGLAKVTPAFRCMAFPLLRDIHYRTNPECWVHVLGSAASGAFSSSGMASCDSSTYANAAQFGLTCGYTHQGFSHAAHWTPKPRKGAAIVEGTTNLMRRMGMFQHSVMNLGRTVHLDELLKLIKL